MGVEEKNREYGRLLLMKDIALDVLASPGCRVCRQFEEFWHSIEKDWPHVTFRHIEVTTREGQEMAQKYMILASPGIILNNELWATGGFDKEKFLKKLKALS
ncbi:MAG: Uncharacterized protein G01um101466_603 [Parcubacteria group bacterium Gr01-1014_66]|nr:MAG: Uncharacterized protein G01um101466_603 [Parcubacteria group bacterium Gr01-1014_66]